jgi:hypothetical protein
MRLICRKLRSTQRYRDHDMLFIGPSIGWRLVESSAGEVRGARITKRKAKLPAHSVPAETFPDRCAFGDGMTGTVGWLEPRPPVPQTFDPRAFEADKSVSYAEFGRLARLKREPEFRVRSMTDGLRQKR